MKKIISLVLALVMIMMVASVYADTPTNNLTADEAISISGLQTGDKASFYQVLKFDQNATTTGGWSNNTGFSLTEEQIQKILGLGDYAPNGTKASKAGIDETIAAVIADMAEKITLADDSKYKDVAEVSGTATVSAPVAGLYVILVKPAVAGTVYNPVFVGCDYKRNDTNGWTVDLRDSYQPASMAKKGVVTLEKTAYDQNSNDNNHNSTVRVGDKIAFTVKTKIPEFSNSYTDAVFNVSDKLSAGLKLDPNSISVAYEGDSEDALPAGAYKTPITTADDGFTIEFEKEYLLRLNKAQPITITYQAEVTGDANYSVNPEDNTVTVNFSNNPTDNEGKGVLKDKTNHYSFDIDAELFGEENYDATEIVKIGIDKDGKELTETRQLDNQHWIGALEGAEFKLYTDSNGAKGSAYTNKFYTADSVFVSDANGRLRLKGSDVQGIRGLDAGVYWLEETQAPDGYIKLQNPVKIEIKTVMKNATYTEVINGITVTYEAEELESYSIEIGGIKTADYTMVNNTEDGKHPHIKATKGDTVVGKDGLIGDSEAGEHPEYGKMQNPQGVELPSTGGIGTTIFYILGGLLVVGAVVILVARRKAQD